MEQARGVAGSGGQKPEDLCGGGRKRGVGKIPHAAPGGFRLGPWAKETSRPRENPHPRLDSRPVPIRALGCRPNQRSLTAHPFVIIALDMRNFVV